VHLSSHHTRAAQSHLSDLGLGALPAAMQEELERCEAAVADLEARIKGLEQQLEAAAKKVGARGGGGIWDCPGASAQHHAK